MIKVNSKKHQGKKSQPQEKSAYLDNNQYDKDRTLKNKIVISETGCALPGSVTLSKLLTLSGLCLLSCKKEIITPTSKVNWRIK